MYISVVLQLVFVLPVAWVRRDNSGHMYSFDDIYDDDFSVGRFENVGSQRTNEVQVML